MPDSLLKVKVFPQRVPRMFQVFLRSRHFSVVHMYKEKVAFFTVHEEAFPSKYFIPIFFELEVTELSLTQQSCQWMSVSMSFKWHHKMLYLIQ